MTKKVIFGLGNPGKKYSLNRHNAGALFVEFLSQKLGSTLLQSKKTNCQFAKISLQGNDIFLAKPLTFMNLSGEAVSKFCQYFGIKPEEIILAHDDLDIPLGKFRIDLARGPKLHKGVASVEKALKTKEFLRVRIGVDNRQKTSWIEGEIYVLQDFPKKELEILRQTFQKIFQKLPEILTK